MSSFFVLQVTQNGGGDNLGMTAYYEVLVAQAGWRAWGLRSSCACRSSCSWTLWSNGMIRGWTRRTTGAPLACSYLL